MLYLVIIFLDYSESRLKDVEPLDGLKYKASYKLILSKLRQIESKSNSQQLNKPGRAGWATTETNRILLQQQCFEVIVSMAQSLQKVAEICLNAIVE